MLNMQNFYTLLTEPSENRDPYSEVMAALTEADRTQISAFESDLEWQQWGLQTSDVVGA